MAGFNRWKSREKFTWAFNVFKKYHISLNRLIWSQIPASEYLLREVKANATGIHAFFYCDPNDQKTIKNDVSEWITDYKEFGNWWRLNALMSLSSYFEIYLSTAISLALESDPGTIHNASGKIDGVIILKHSDEYNYQDQVKACIVGEWPKRISAYNRLFSFSPPKLVSSVSELEKFRKIRNRIGHSFGRDIEKSKAKGVKSTLEIERVSQQQLKKFLGLIYEIVMAIDAHLIGSHIGDYETIYFYHQLRKTLVTKHLTREKEAALKKKLGILGSHVNKDYCESLVDYYEKL